jgi:hypothetical protein
LRVGVEQLAPVSFDVDADAPQIELPAHVPQRVVARREAQRDRERAPLERAEARRQRADLATQLGPAQLVQLVALAHVLVLEHDRRMAGGVPGIDMAQDPLQVVDLGSGKPSRPRHHVVVGSKTRPRVASSQRV